MAAIKAKGERKRETRRGRRRRRWCKRGRERERRTAKRREEGREGITAKMRLGDVVY